MIQMNSSEFELPRLNRRGFFLFRQAKHVNLDLLKGHRPKTF